MFSNAIPKNLEPTLETFPAEQVGFKTLQGSFILNNWYLKSDYPKSFTLQGWSNVLTLGYPGYHIATPTSVEDSKPNLQAHHDSLHINLSHLKSLCVASILPSSILTQIPNKPSKKNPTFQVSHKRHLALEIVGTFTVKTQNWNHEPHLRAWPNCGHVCDLSYRMEMIVGTEVCWPRNNNMGTPMKVNQINVIS